MDECSFTASCVSVRVRVRVCVCVCIPMPGITLIGCWCQSGHLVCGLSQEKEREQTLYSLAKVVNGADPTTDTALVVGRLYVTIIKCTKGEKDKKHSEYILRLKKCQIRFVPQCLHLFPESSWCVCVCLKSYTSRLRKGQTVSGACCATGARSHHRPLTIPLDIVYHPPVNFEKSC